MDIKLELRAARPGLVSVETRGAPGQLELTIRLSSEMGRTEGDESKPKQNASSRGGPKCGEPSGDEVRQDESRQREPKDEERTKTERIETGANRD